MHKNHRWWSRDGKENGFTLIELSIVLVIVGLLVGGVIVGQGMIRAAELRSVISQTTNTITALNTFRDKYLALPGDMPNATRYWGTDPNGCPSNTVRTQKKETCDGDGDGKLLGNSEGFRAWQHLADAGLIEGMYSGVTGAAQVVDCDPGINCPKLKMGSNGGMSIGYNGVITPNQVPYLFPKDYGNALEVGACGDWECIEGFFKPEEAWKMDTKIDDGKPGTGQMVTRASCVGNYSAGCATGCNTATDTSAASAVSAMFDLTNTTAACGFYYSF